MILSDNHVHTSFSADSSTSMEAMVQRAIELHLPSVCFTDHLDYGFPEQYHTEFLFSLEDYFDTIQNLKEKYPSLQIRTGVELGLKEDIFETISAIPERNQFDFVIGSTHIVDNLDPYYEEYWENLGEENGISHYFEKTYDNIKLNFDIDSYGHLDYIIRYCPTVKRAKKQGTENESFYQKTLKKNKEILDEILLSLIQLGKGLEVNTAGLRYGLGHPNPHEAILQRYRELGGTTITIGSDAHETKYLAYSFGQIPELLLKCGFNYCTEFSKRRPVQIPFI